MLAIMVAQPESPFCLRTQDVALVGGGGARCDGGLPVGLVHENRAEVAHQVDDAKHQSALRLAYIAKLWTHVQPAGPATLALCGLAGAKLNRALHDTQCRCTVGKSPG